MSPRNFALITSITACTFTLTFAFGFQQDGQGGVPAGHPAVGTPASQVPAGHENMEKPEAPKMAVPLHEAKPEDVKSIDAIVDAYYNSVSGGKGVARDWERFLSLFMPNGRFNTSRLIDGKVIPVALSPDEFVAMNRGYFEGGGYFEKDIHRITNTYGNIAQVFSTYASRRKLLDPKPYSRGINSIQLLKAGGRWWIVSIMWDYENGQEDHILPAEYLPASAVEGG